MEPQPMQARRQRRHMPRGFSIVTTNSVDPATRPLAAALGRLRARLLPLLVFAAIVALLLVAGRLALVEAAILAALGVAIAALLPVACRSDGATVSEQSLSTGSGWLGAIAGLADILADPLVLLDRRNIVLYRNPAAQRQFPAAAPGSAMAVVLRWPALVHAIEAARQTGTPATAELHLTVPNETWYALAVAPIAHDHGLPEGLLAVTLRDLTKERRIDQLRTDFIANASHELRTPLTSLMGFIDTLLGPAARDAAARERFLGIMRQQATRMSKLIDDLLSLSRIEMRQHMRPTGSVELGQLLGEVRDGLETQAGEAGVVVTLSLPETPTAITGDRDELYEVFENLLENAIKYGGDGGSVEIALGPSRRSGYDYLVTVTDHGAGIAAEHVPRLTERFYRVDADQSRRKKGTGLGLAIVKHIVSRHHGLLSIRSKPGEGTRVEVLLVR
jgi:two-component system phosphate regulon sensor histidine kinase PhoR